MYSIHKDRNGNTKMVCQMTDDHLMNAIRLLLRQVRQDVEILENRVSVPAILSAFHSEFSDSAMKDTARKHIRKCVEMLQPYLMEVFMRTGLAVQVQEEMQAAFGRIGAQPNFPMAGLIEGQGQCPGSDEDMDYEIEAY